MLDTKDFFGWGQKVIGNDELTMRIAVAYFEARIAEAVANDSMERFQKERARIAEAAHHAVTVPCRATFEGDNAAKISASLWPDAESQGL